MVNIGEKTLNEIGEYFYLGEVADGYVRTANATAERRLSKQDIEKIKLFGIMENMQEVKEELHGG